MKAVVMERYGTPDVLETRDVPTPTPKANEVLVRVHAASINDWDYGLLLGTSLIDRMMSGLFRPRVQILGCDTAGIVEAVGEGPGHPGPRPDLEAGVGTPVLGGGNGRQRG